MVDQINSGLNIGPVQPGGKPSVRPASPQQGPAFQDLLDQKIEQQDDLKFSMHAMERIRMRRLPLSMHEINRLKQGVNQVSEKGGKDSVVLMDDTAYVVSVKNRTVVTAIGGEQMKNNVFTNIDSAVIV